MIIPNPPNPPPPLLITMQVLPHTIFNLPVATATPLSGLVALAARA